MKIKLNIQWRDYQSDTLSKILSADEGTSHVIRSPRQAGKTTLIQALILYCAINYKNSVSIFVEPTVRQCKKVFRELRKMIEKLPILNTSSESTMDITLTNGSQIIFLSAESDIAALQGYTVKNGGMLVFDEAAFISDDIFQALAPSTDVYKAKTIFTSTPRFRTGTFYNYFIEGLSSKQIISYDWAGKTILTPEKLDFYRRTLPLNTFKNYYLGCWAEYGSNVFGDISSCIREPLHNAGCVFGIDWGTGSNGDDTAITIFNTKKEMVKTITFNDKNATETIEYIISLASEYKPSKIQVELNSIGKVFYELLQKEINRNYIQTQLIGFNTTNDSKCKLVDKFAIAIQNKEVSILNDEKLLHQISTFESKPTGTGKITYAAVKNGHDDAVLSMLLAYDCLTSGSYSYI